MARKCGFESIVDRQVDKYTKGHERNNETVVGTLHFVIIQFMKSISFPCTLGVIDGLSVDLIMGLDMIIHNNLNINLKNNALDIGCTSLSIPFTDPQSSKALTSMTIK